MNALSAHVLVFLLCCVSATAASTYLIEERAQVCFFRYVEEETKLQAKVFVFKGGNLDIGFSVRGPSQLDDRGNVVHGRTKLKLRKSAKITSENILEDNDDSAELFSGYDYKFDAEKGEYEICLSNDKSYAQEAKHVMLDISEVVEDGATKKHAKDDTTDLQDAGGSPKNKEDLAIITKEMDGLSKVFEEIKSFQELERMQLTQRKTAAEDNNASMVQSSVLETIVLLLVGIGQIIFVRKWFSGKGTLLKQWA
ncbi:expressed unknown protein [Ectocarpus siliculosus]|uniref:GOLD domain-containing protein n=1 Tax=Ectocarpus siliculosus TaxID=2880 RepID=D7FKV3_ECTSI|nr:expressed unknown protein [Ectocarpus siliculosus]|eukprot:CBJ29498.1 expressed unknown protein [Ectocarpus siliculosus]